jgi:hypothetical protein
MDPLWYKDAIIYETHVKAFSDSNGDGIGDFGGLIEKLDYLHDLGITCVWLLPVFPSPLRDDGYDIADYTNVHPSYGTLDDFKRFLGAAHDRNLQVIIELVINHTSDQHPWFQQARTAQPGSLERDIYVWSDTPCLSFLAICPRTAVRSLPSPPVPSTFPDYARWTIRQRAMSPRRKGFRPNSAIGPSWTLREM